MLDRDTSVRFLVGQAVQALEGAGFLGKRSQRGKRWKQVWTIGQIGLESFGLTGHHLDAFIGACKPTTSKQQHALDGFVRLGVGVVEAFHIQVMGCTEQSQGHQKRGGRPISVHGSVHGCGSLFAWNANAQAAAFILQNLHHNAHVFEDFERHVEVGATHHVFDVEFGI